MVPWQTPRDVASLTSLGISILVRLKTSFHHMWWKSLRLGSVHDYGIVYALYLIPSQFVDPLCGYLIWPTIPVSTSGCDVVVLAHPTSRSLLVQYTPPGLTIRKCTPGIDDVYIRTLIPHLPLWRSHSPYFPLRSSPHVWGQFLAYLRQPTSKILVY